MIRRNVTCFVGGSLQKLDLDENGRPVGVLKEAVQGESQDTTKHQLMAQLKEAGIPFKATMSKEELKALLSKPSAPEGNTGEQGGTGNQDVI